METTWLEPAKDACEHDFSIEHEVPKADLPPFVSGPIVERYCSACGIKMSLKDHIAASLRAGQDAPPEPPQEIPPPPRVHVFTPDDLEPVPLDQIEVELNVEYYGKRYDNNRRRGIKDKAIHIEGDLRLNEALAAAAEEYVAKALGLRHRHDNLGPDRGWDMVMPNGHRVGVKWTHRHDGRLISSPKQTNMADYYVLVTGPDPENFIVQGWATLAELKASLRDLGYGPTYAVNQEDLRAFDSLLEIRRQGAH